MPIESPTHCANCGKPLGVPPPSAPHRKFCSTKCRMEWHGARLRDLRAKLRETDEGAKPKPRLEDLI